MIQLETKTEKFSPFTTAASVKQVARLQIRRASVSIVAQKETFLILTSLVPTTVYLRKPSDMFCGFSSAASINFMGTLTPASNVFHYLKGGLFEAFNVPELSSLC